MSGCRGYKKSSNSGNFSGSVEERLKGSQYCLPFLLCGNLVRLLKTSSRLLIALPPFPLARCFSFLTPSMEKTTELGHRALGIGEKGIEKWKKIWKSLI